MQRRTSLSALAALAFIPLSPSRGAEELEQRTFENEHLGKVSLLVPTEWNLYARGHIRFGTTFLSPQPTGSEEFEITINDAEHLQFRWKSAAELKEFLSGQMQQYVGRSKERAVAVKSKAGANTVFYSTLTDSQPKPGEFKLVTLGVARTGPAVFLIFQLTNEQRLVERPVAVVAGARRT